MSDQRLHYLDGLRGILAVIVFVHHFLYAFCPNIICGGSYEVFLTGQWTIERALAFTPFNILFNPGMAINFFFLLSGYVQSWHYFNKPELFLLQKSFLKRYFRLAIPTLSVVILVFIFHRLHLIDKKHFPPNALTFEWIKSMMPDTLNVFEMLRYGLVDCFTSKIQNYQVLWTMPTELYNSWMVLILLMVTHRLKNKLPLFVVWFFVQLIFMQSFYGMSFTLGLIIGYLKVHTPRFTQLFSGAFLKLICVVVGSYFASFPFTGYQNSSQQSMYSPISFFDRYPSVISYAFGNLLLLCVILNSKRVQKILSNTALLFFGEISFMFYLVHFLLLFSFSPWLFFTLFRYLHNGPSNYLITGFASFGLITLVSFVLYKLVDLPALKLCNRLVKKVFLPQSQSEL